MAGTLIRRTSPCTRIMGGRPEERCRSEALFLTTKASSSVRSITILPVVAGHEENSRSVSGNYGNNYRQPASRERPHRARRGGGAARLVFGRARRGVQDSPTVAGARGARRGPEGLRGELRPGGAGKNGRAWLAAGMAPDRTASVEQDAARRRALRLGAYPRARENRAPPLRAAPRRARRAQCPHPAQCFRRALQERGERRRDSRPGAVDRDAG